VLYRLACLVAFAVWLVAEALPAGSRSLGRVVGLSCLCLFFSVVVSLQLGQVDAWVALSLAAGIYFGSRDRWGLAGIGLGAATLIKISPGLLILYLALRGKRVAAVSAAATIVVALTLATLLGRPDNLWVWAHQVLPSLAKASRHIQNQSLLAWLARIFQREPDQMVYGAGLGAFSRLVLPTALAGTLALAFRRRGCEWAPLELGWMIVFALLCGPISWDHYVSWSILSIVVLCDRRRWLSLPGRQASILGTFLFISAVFLATPVRYFDAKAILASGVNRLLTGVNTCGLLILLAVGGTLLFQTQPVAEESVGAVKAAR
jgi:alpha-1,2-mannosyltransferase